jgi:quinoprotein glucose dehydrogenase
LRAEAVALVAKHQLGPIFTPPALSDANGPIGTMMLPSTTGGANWPGASVDPETGIMYVFSNTNIVSRGLVKPDPKVSTMDYVSGVARPAPAASGDRASTPAPARPAGEEGGEGGGGLTVQGLPLVKPPYGRITALDLNAGSILWQIAHGETPDNIKNHPVLKGLTLPRTGRQGRIGTLVTKTLVIAGEGGFGPTPSGARGAMLRAYDKGTGAEVGAVYLPAPQTGSPMTYAINGRQYLTVAVSGGTYSGELITFRTGS